MVVPVCGVVTTVVGGVLVIAATVVTLVGVPSLLRNAVKKEVALFDETAQMDRFKSLPFPLNFDIRIFHVTNPKAAINNGIPILEERGPYKYKMTRERIIHEVHEDYIVYQIVDTMKFDAEGSYPCTEDDMVTIVNAPYHLILQIAEVEQPGLMSFIGGNLVLNGVFREFATPYATYRVRDILFDGITFCKNALHPISALFCRVIRSKASTTNNLEVLPDGSVSFSFFRHKNGRPGHVFKVNRGVNNVDYLGQIYEWNHSTRLDVWSDIVTKGDDHEKSVCNKLNGTDTGIFSPFVDISKPLFGFNPDICRSVELRFEKNEVYKNVPVLRFSALQWFLDNKDGCFCLNKTQGITQPNGCLFKGAIELFNCVGAHMVLSYPHFLFADFAYRNGLVGMTPREDDHKIFVDLEPTSGIVIRGAKRAQFNLFSRPIRGVGATEKLRTILTPVFWGEEGVELPQVHVDEIKEKLLSRLEMANILIPILLSISVLVLLVGIIVIIVRCRSNQNELVSLDKSQ